MRAARAIVIGPVHAHRAAGDAIFAISDAGLHPVFREGSIAVVTVELVGLGIVADEDVRPAVAIDVDNTYAERLAVGIADARFVRYVIELAAAEVVIQPARRAFIGFGSAIRLGRAV